MSGIGKTFLNLIRIEVLLGISLVGMFLIFNLDPATPSVGKPQDRTMSQGHELDTSNSQLLMFSSADSAEAKLVGAADLKLNLEALEQGRAVWLPVGPNGQLVEFSNYETTKERNSTSFIGALTLGGVELPTTITTSERSIFATIPTAEGVIEGRGRPDNIAFQKRPAFRDLIDLNLLGEESTEVHRASEGTCLNC